MRQPSKPQKSAKKQKTQNKERQLTTGNRNRTRQLFSTFAHFWGCGIYAIFLQPVITVFKQIYPELYGS